MFRNLSEGLRRSIVTKVAAVLVLAFVADLAFDAWRSSGSGAPRAQVAGEVSFTSSAAIPEGKDMPRNGGANAGLVVPISAPSALQSPEQSFVRAVLGYSVPALIAVLLFLFLSRHVGRPLRDLIAALERLGRGRTDIELGDSRRRDEIGRLSAAIGVMRQALLDREAEEAALRATLAQNVRLLDRAPVGLLIEQDGLIIACNAMLERLFGYQSGELVGQPRSLLHAGEAADTAIHAPGTGTQTGQGLRECLLRRKDGSRFWGALQCARADAEDAEPSFTWAYTDITESKRVATERDERCQRLERLVAERNAEIEAFRQCAAGPGDAVAVSVRKGKGQPAAEIISFDLPALLADIGDLLSIQAEEKGLELVMDVDPGLPGQLVGDPMRFGELLTSLMSHVIARASEGDLVLSVHEDCRQENGIRLRCCVSAAGGSNGKTSRRPRSGKGRSSSRPRALDDDEMGLAIARSLAELAGGRLDVENRDGQAVAFHFGISFGIAEIPVEDRVAAYVDRLRALAGRRVMVVDDRRSSRLVAGALLAKLGFVPTLFESGWSALASLSSPEAPSYLFICIDQDMPELNGTELARRLRAHYGRTTPPLLLMAAAGRGGLPKGLAAGFAAVIPKPLGLERLFVHAATALGISPAGSSHASAKATLPAAVVAGKRVLLAAEASPAQEALADYLRDAGLRVRLAYSGIEVLQAVREEAPDCLLLDCGLPAIDGCETASRLRALGYAGLPIIALSTHGKAAGTAICLAAGMNDVVARPGDFRPLAAALCRWLAAPAPVPPVAKPGEAEEQILPTLPGLDLESGLRHLQGKTGLLLKALRTFRDSWGQQFLMEFRAAVAAADWPAAARLAANLKSHAATIGATEVSATAARLEAVIGASDHAAVPPLLAELSEKLRIIVEGLARIR